MMKNDEKKLKNDEKWWKIMKHDEKWWKIASGYVKIAIEHGLL